MQPLSNLLFPSLALNLEAWHCLLVGRNSSDKSGVANVMTNVGNGVRRKRYQVKVT